MEGRVDEHTAILGMEFARSYQVYKEGRRSKGEGNVLCYHNGKELGRGLEHSSC